MEHAQSKRPRLDLEALPNEAPLSYEPEREMSEIPGHLQQQLLQGRVRTLTVALAFHLALLLANSLLLLWVQVLPAFPGSHRFGKPAWLDSLIAQLEFDVTGHLRRWNLIPLLVLAKHYNDMYIHWEALGALVELWHPQTNTFVFHGYEASVLLEEVELFLGLKRPTEESAETAHCIARPDPRAFMADLSANWVQVKNITGPSGIQLRRLSIWLTTAKDRGVSTENIARGFSLCIAGVILFPTYEDFMTREHLGVMQGVWQGRSAAPAVLAYLYSGLTSSCLGGTVYGCMVLLDMWLSCHVKMDYGPPDSPLAGSYKRSPIFRMRDALGYTDSMIVKTLSLHTRAEWRVFLLRLPPFDFTSHTGVLTTLRYRSRPSAGVDLHLVGAKELVLYNAHRCHFQLGLPRHEFSPLSHHPPIKLRRFGTPEDPVEVRSCLQMWKISRVHELLEARADEDPELVRAFVYRVRKLGFKKVRPQSDPPPLPPFGP